MRVLLVADVVGGVRTFVRELAGRLTARGVDVHLALLGSDEARECERLGARSCEARDLRLEWMPEPWADVLEASEWIERLSAEHRPDLIHMNTFTPIRCEDAPVLLTAHSCVLTWWRAVHGRDAPDGWNRYRRIAGQALRRANLLTVPTRALRDELRVVHGWLPPTRVIANGRTLVRRDHGTARRERLVVSVGRIWDPAKNARALAEAAHAIAARVVLIGPDREDARENAETRDEALDNVETPGSLDQADVLRWLRRAELFAEPARYEPFGLAALEAALCGCALVLGDIPSLREVWGDAATFVPPDDPQALAAAINRLLDDPARCRGAAAAAHARAAEYSARAMADAHFDAYEQLVRQAVAA